MLCNGVGWAGDGSSRRVYVLPLTMTVCRDPQRKEPPYDMAHGSGSPHRAGDTFTGAGRVTGVCQMDGEGQRLHVKGVQDRELSENWHQSLEELVPSEPK